MAFNPGISPGQIISNSEISNIFKCSPQGGMRKSNTLNILVLISDPKKPLYQDEWRGNILHYTGMGQKGDQDINSGQNKTLRDSNKNGVDVFLFEKLDKDEYLFHGQVKLAADPYQDEQPDIEGKMRKVWIFPLQLLNLKEPAPLPEEIWQAQLETSRKEAAVLSDEELERRARKSQGISSERTVTTRQRSRDQYVAEYVKRRAAGKCDLCGKDAPFRDTSGKPYLEVHHIEWLSKGGMDTIENAVALCPNCHRKMHVLNLVKDKEKLSALYGQA